jgi:hypothetical protein
MATCLTVGIQIVIALVQFVMSLGLQGRTGFAPAGGALFALELLTALNIVSVVLGRGLSPGSGGQQTQAEQAGTQNSGWVCK